MLGKLFARYLVISGVVLNGLLVLALGYGVYKVVNLGVGLDVIAGKLADKVESRAPIVSNFIRSITQFTLPGYKFDHLLLEEWNGKGASSARVLDAVAGSAELAAFVPEEKRLNKRVVNSVDELFSALNAAMPGDVIVLSPGVYELKKKKIIIQRPGTPMNPIYLQADTLGKVILKMNTLEGFYVNAPHWVFQNLRMEGVCPTHGQCEHAFHVVGGGRYVVIRNNIVIDFNAHIKVNPTVEKGVQQFPDKGVIEGNTFFNRTIRATDSPVTLLDIIATDSWVVQDNLIADFVKGGGNKVSYAAFFKGAGTRNIFERNLVICRFNLLQKGGAQVGLSLGGGGTSPSVCRDGKCDVEDIGGTIRHNVIMNCDDVGIYLNKAKNSEIYNNTIINTLGIDVRFSQSNAVIANNILTGRIKERDGGVSEQYANLVMDIDDIDDVFKDALQGDFMLLGKTEIVDQGMDLQEKERDFCGRLRSVERVDIGAFEYQEELTPQCNPFGM